MQRNVEVRLGHVRLVDLDDQVQIEIVVLAIDMEKLHPKT